MQLNEYLSWIQEKETKELHRKFIQEKYKDLNWREAFYELAFNVMVLSAQIQKLEDK